MSVPGWSEVIEVLSRRDRTAIDPDFAGSAFLLPELEQSSILGCNHFMKIMRGIDKDAWKAFRIA